MRLRRVLTLLMIIPFVACKKSDQDAPVVDSIAVNGSSEVYYANASASNHFEVAMSDNQNLKQMKIAFSSVSGLHHHEDASSHAFMEVNQGEWDSLRIENLSGKSATESFDFLIPETVSGGWKMTVSVIDETGNLTEVDKTLHILNDLMPQISIASTTPEAGSMGEINLAVGGSLSLSGSVLDVDSLSFVKVEVKRFSSITYENTWTDINSWTFDLAPVSLPVFDTAGTYTVLITAMDNLGWSRTVQASVVVE